LAIGKNASYIHLLESNKTTFEPSLSVLLDIIEACGSTHAEFFSEDINQYLDLLSPNEFFCDLL